VVADERDAAEAGALQLGVDEHRTGGVGDAVDPEAAFGVDPLAVGFGFELRGIQAIKIFGVAADLPCEGFGRSS